MKIFKILFIFLILLIFIVFIGAAFIPSSLKFEVSKKMEIKKAVVFNQVNCFKNWKNWSPWLDVIKNEAYKGPECGVGSKMIWEDEKGGGIQEIIESNGLDFIKTKLDFREQAYSYSIWTFTDNETGVEVRWSFETDLAFPLGRWIGLLLIKPGLEKSYNKGLEQLETHCKTIKPKDSLEEGEVIIDEVKGKDILSIQNTTTYNEIEEKMGKNYATIILFIERYDLEKTGFPIAIWHDFNPEPTAENTYECAIPVKECNIDDAGIKYYHSYEGKVVTAVHYGSYESSYITWTAIDKFIDDNQLINNGSPWEEYIIDPSSEADTSKWVTQIYQPIK